MQATDELYLKYAGVIASVVNHYSRQFPELDIQDELYLQAGLIFCEACSTYDPEHPSGATFDTWLRNKLKALTYLIDKALHGPSTTMSRGASPVRSYSPDGDEQDVGDPSSGIFAPAIATGILDEYSSQLSLSDDYHQELRQYLDALRGDSLQVFKDFVEGYFKAKPDPSKSRKFNIEAMNYLTPMKIYRRRYLKLCWTLERTRKAFNGVHNMLTLYMQGRLPCHLIPQT